MRRLIFVSLLCGLCILLIGASQPPTADLELNPSFSPTDAEGLSDWPQLHFDAQRSNYNILETDLLGTFSSTPAGLFSYGNSNNTFVMPTGSVVEDTVLWRDQAFDGDAERFLLAATDLFGNELWRVDVPNNTFFSRTSVPTVVGDVVLIMEIITDSSSFEEETTLVARSLATGGELWRHPGGISRINSNEPYPQMAADDDYVYVSWEDDDRKGQIAKIDIDTGATVWQIEPDNVGNDESEFLALTASSSGLSMLVGVHFSNLIGYDTGSGVELWDTDMSDVGGGTSVFTSPQDLLVYDDQAFFVNNAKLAAVDLSTGVIEWEKIYHNDDSCESGGDVGLATDGRNVFISGECNEDLVAYDLASGVETWRQTVYREVGLNRNIAVANGYVYADGFDDQAGNGLSSQIFVFDLNGVPQQSIVVDDAIGGSFNSVRALSVANGSLYVATSQASGPGTMVIFGAGTNGSSLYLNSYDNDPYAVTNPTETETVPIVEHDGSYGVEISVAAKIGTNPARFVVYNADGSIYKEVTGSPNPQGFGYFNAPLEYAAAGYEYQVILNSGDELPRRKVSMPADPAAAVTRIEDTDGLTWNNPPATITSTPATVSVGLPGIFPSGTTTATLYLQEAGRGIITIPGTRSGNSVNFTIDDDSGLNGDFTATAIAEAESGGVTTVAYSADQVISIDSSALPDVRVQSTTAFLPQTDGTYQLYTYRFDRERPTVDRTTSVDAQIASVVPDPAGYQVTLFVQTPAANPADPATQKWEVGLQGVDSSGNVLNFITQEINATTEGIYVPMILPQPSDGVIARIEAIGSVLDSSRRFDPFNGGQLALAPRAAGCGPGNSGSPGDNGNNPNEKPFGISDVINVTIDGGGSAEYVTGVGGSATTYAQYELMNGQAQACVEAGGRVGGGVGLGPMAAGGVSINLRGPGHQAPANSGTKYDITAEAGLGVQVSYTVPDNWGDGGYGTIGFGVTGAPSAAVSGGASLYKCKPLNPPESDECCKGGRCGPNPPNPPGNDHPDDTESVVINRVVQTETSAEVEFWQTASRFARREGFSELLSYALFRLDDANRLNEISDYPILTDLGDEQEANWARQEAERIANAAQLQANWPTIQAQLDLLEATRANVLANGYYEQMQALLESYGIPTRLITPDFAPDALSDALIVVPTAGFYGLQGDTAFAARLERFVNQGGTLMVMTQPEDNGYDLLPGSWTSVGYQDDQSCWQAAMTPVAEHPMLASLNESTVKANVDGYMSAWPSTAELLLKRTKNDQGAFILDRYGEGHMIVTSMYDDWGRTVGQSSRQVRDLFRDVTRWALTADDEMTSTRLNQQVSVPLTLINTSSTAAAQVEYTIRNASGEISQDGPGAVSLAVPADGSRQVNVPVTPSNANYGLWSINYTLLDSSGNDLSGEVFGSYFALNGQDLARYDFGLDTFDVRAPSEPFQGSVTADVGFDQTGYSDGETVNAAVNVNVSGGSGQLLVSVSLGAETQERLISASTQTVNFSLPADFSNGGLFFFAVYDDATDEGVYLDTSWVQPEGTTATIVPDQTLYAPGDSVTLNITGSYSGTVAVDGPDFSESLAVTSTDTTAQLTLPTPLASGSYDVSYTDSGSPLVAHFDVVGPLVTVTEMGIDSAIADVGESVNVTAEIFADQTVNTTIYGEMVDTNGIVVGAFTGNQTLSSGSQAVLMPVSVASTAAATVRYDITIVDAADTSIVYATAHRFISLDQPLLLGLNTDGGVIESSDTTIGVDFYSPSEKTVTLSLEIDGESVSRQSVTVPSGFSTQSVTLPSSLSTGGHVATIESEIDGLTSLIEESFVVGAAPPEAGDGKIIHLPFIFEP